MDPRDTNEEEGPLGLLLHPPAAVAAIGVVLALAYVGVSLLPPGGAYRIWHLFELSPARVLRAAETGAYLGGVVRPFLGHMLFHINLAHLLVNLAAIVLCGSFVHREMALQAGARSHDAPAVFVAFFLLCGLAGGFGFMLADPRSAQSVVGASGAAAGLLGACAWIIIMRFNGEPARAGAGRRIVTLALVSVLIVGATVFLDNSPVSRLLFGRPGAWQAHAGGYIFGLLSYPLFEHLARDGKRNA